MAVKTILIIFTVTLLFQAAAYPLELSRVVLTRDIKDNEPADSDTVFFQVEKAVYCFTEFINILRPTRVIHKWFCNNKELARIELEVKPAPRWRTWSKKRFKNCSGQWKVQVFDQKGKLLAEKKFLVRKL